MFYVHIFKKQDLFNRLNESASQSHDLHRVAAQLQHGRIFKLICSFFQLWIESAKVLFGDALLGASLLLFVLISKLIFVFNISLIIFPFDFLDGFHVKFANYKWILCLLSITCRGSKLFGVKENLVWISDDGIIIDILKPLLLLVVEICLIINNFQLSREIVKYRALQERSQQTIIRPMSFYSIQERALYCCDNFWDAGQWLIEV